VDVRPIGRGQVHGLSLCFTCKLSVFVLIFGLLWMKVWWTLCKVVIVGMTNSDSLDDSIAVCVLPTTSPNSFQRFKTEMNNRLGEITVLHAASFKAFQCDIHYFSSFQ
jgi:hypothetical protein